MKYTLTHKNIPVLDFTMDVSGCVLDIDQVFSVNDLPIRTTPDKDSLQKWWADRTAYAEREGLIQLFYDTSMPKPSRRFLPYSSISPNDTYWIKAKDLDLCWEEVNYLQNPVQDALDDLLSRHIGEDGSIGEHSESTS